MPRGGARTGAGRPKGKAGPQRRTIIATIEKEILREQTRAIIAPHLQQLLTAQIAHATGLKYLVTRDKKTGKFIRVGPAMAAHAGEETIEVWEKDPSTQAFTDLLNRLLDKPKEQEQEVKVSGELTLLDKIARARQRLAVNGSAHS